MAKRDNGGKPPKKSPKGKGLAKRKGQGVNGNLKIGNNPGYRGGGRPRSALREQMLGSLEERWHIANEIADDESVAERDRLAALAFLARFSAMEQKGAIVVDAELLNEFFAVIELYVQDEVALADIREKWLDTLADRIGSR